MSDGQSMGEYEEQLGLADDAGNPENDMGEMSEYHEDTGDILEGKAKPTVWTTKDGRKVPFIELEDGHLKNVLRFLLRRAAVNKAMREVQAMLTPEPNGEAAWDAWSSEMDSFIGRSVWAYARESGAFVALLREADRRDKEEAEAGEDGLAPAKVWAGFRNELRALKKDLDDRAANIALNVVGKVMLKSARDVKGE